MAYKLIICEITRYAQQIFRRDRVHDLLYCPWLGRTTGELQSSTWYAWSKLSVKKISRHCPSESLSSVSDWLRHFPLSRHTGCVTFPCHVIHLITVMTTTSTSCTSAWHVSITKPQLLFSNGQYLTQLSLWCTSECYDPSTDDVHNVEQNSGAHTKKSHCSKHITGCNYLYPHSTAGYTRTFSPLSPPMLPISRVVSHRQWSKVVPLMWLASYEHTWEKMPMMLVVWSSHKRG